MLRIAAWNVNSLRVRLGQVLDWMDAHRPDVLLLQETKVEDALFPVDDFAERGYFLAFHGQKSYNGVAIVSRFPLRDVEAGLGVEEDTGARVLAATLGEGERAVRVASVYVVNGEDVDSPKFAVKKRFFENLETWLQKQAKRGEKVVVGGDFNVACDARDVDDAVKREGKVLFTVDERKWLQHLLQTCGVRDALRCVSAAAGVFSWWDYRAGALEGNRGMRIDYILVGDGVEVKEVVHHKDMRANVQPSDHVPVMATLEVGRE